MSLISGFISRIEHGRTRSFSSRGVYTLELLETISVSKLGRDSLRSTSTFCGYKHGQIRSLLLFRNSWNDWETVSRGKN